MPRVPKVAERGLTVSVYIRSAHLIVLCLPNRFIFDDFESKPWTRYESQYKLESFS